MAKNGRRRKPRIRRRTVPGTSPGTVEIDPQSPAPRISAISFGPDSVAQIEIENVKKLKPLVGKKPVTWINVAGLGDRKIIEDVGKAFGLHPLAMEDVVNAHQHAKVEDYGNVLYIVMRMVEPTQNFDTEQISIFVGKNFIITFQEHAGDGFDHIRQRIQQATSRLRQSGSDYLAYRIIDTVIDGYFLVLEKLGDRLEQLDEEFDANLREINFRSIQEVKADLLLARRAIRPHRDAVNQLMRDTYPQISDETRLFMRDCSDHTMQIMDLVETYREICADLRDYCLSIVSNRMNETMKVLTMIATVFIPLGFIAGLYGMNFNSEKSAWNMPELNYTYGYPAVLGVMIAIAVGMLVFFRSRGWLGSQT